LIDILMKRGSNRDNQEKTHELPTKHAVQSAPKLLFSIITFFSQIHGQYSTSYIGWFHVFA